MQRETFRIRTAPASRGSKMKCEVLWLIAHSRRLERFHEAMEIFQTRVNEYQKYIETLGGEIKDIKQSGDPLTGCLVVTIWYTPAKSEDSDAKQV